jgi:RNA polymerase primary sigma factor
LTTSSLDAPIKADEGNSCLVDLIADSYTESPLELVQRSIDQEQLSLWLNHLNQQEREVLSLRFGLDGHNRHSLAEIGRNLDVSRERIRQVELKALRKLRQIIRKAPVAISI